MPAAIQSAILEIIPAPLLSALAGDRGGAQAFQEHLRYQMDSGGLPALTQGSDVAALSEPAGKPSPPPEVALAPSGKKAGKTSAAAGVAMVAAPIPFDPQLPTLLDVGTAPVAKSGISVDAKPLADQAGPVAFPARAQGASPELPSLKTTADASQLPHPSSTPAARPQGDAQPSEENRPAHDRWMDSRIEDRATVVEVAPAKPQPRISSPVIAPNYAPLPAMPSPIPGSLLRNDTEGLSLAEPSAAPSTKPAVSPLPQPIRKSNPVSQHILLAASVSARSFIQPNLRTLAVHLQAEPSLRYLTRSDTHEFAQGFSRESDGKAGAGDKRSEPAPASRSRDAGAVSAMKSSVEKAPTEKSPVEKSPAEKAPAENTPVNPKGSIPADCPATAPQRGMQGAKLVIAQASGTPVPGGATPSAQTPTAADGPQTAGTPAKPDSLHPADPAPAADVAPVHSARFMSSGNDSEMRVGLRTESFGTVQVHTAVSEKQVELALGSERGDLRSLIASDLPSLQTSLQQHDLRLHEVHSLEQVSPERNFAGHSSGNSSGNSARHPGDSGRRHPLSFGDDFSSDNLDHSGEERETDLSVHGRGLSIRA